VAEGNRANDNATATLLTVVVVVAVLYFAREVFIPLALAILLAFLLAPLVFHLRRWHIPRVLAVLSAVLFAFILLGIIGTFMASQLTDLAHKLPEYQHNVHQKLESIRSSGSGLVTRVSRLIQNFSDELRPPQPSRNQNQRNDEKPVPVEIRHSNFSPVEIIQKVLGSVVSGVVTAAIVIVFVIFMLFQQEDLRDRLIRLVGAGRINATTKALDEAGARVSRYLLAQLIINSAYGILAGIALYALGVPNPVLWGIMAALFRYIPYLGIWIAALLSAALAFAVEPGWVKVVLVFSLYFGIDLLMYNFAEPFLYGSSTGVSPLAILVAAVFWTWLWGPVGLLLSTPLTVCVVVIGRYVPSLEFLSVMLSDDEVLRPEARFYQRLLAMDLEEATGIAEDFLKSGKPLEEVYDSVIIPALSLAEQDRHQGRLDEQRQRFIFQHTRVLVEDLAERAEELSAGNQAKTRGAAHAPPAETASQESAKESGAPGAASTTPPQVLCVPARDEADEIAAFMLAQLLNRRGVGAKALPAGYLACEPVEEVKREKPPIACVFAVPPFGYTHARYLCRRLQGQFRELKLIAAILTEGDVQEVKNRQPAIRANELVSSLKQALDQIFSLVPSTPSG
jgi:predicted PurR-regulated permease PerM